MTRATSFLPSAVAPASGPQLGAAGSMTLWLKAEIGVTERVCLNGLKDKKNSKPDRRSGG